ncbi:2-C-methyl-D-erythritol 4-phosphate cytidylyltransferase [Hydromonas duriensis]|uniref:2-C-methyl-D-erythritol 4-phosphate cytidylyltransferase n=1 Tax=Hydromonas duriensis TaxID=1527608 RepID=A0A4R6Y9N2_9BURK|nr:2-C-methyl-D-erythritol 4-phosphate cytidylyltransferase [Hydromonas duriensis]TDR32205.1 2-C-methyl-D-erythritol 4-phosphate cytidylyltransferase [Hydromonas duriensis]
MSQAKTSVVALICAAGQGERAGTPLPKQYKELNGVPMLVHTIMAFLKCDVVQEVYVVLSPKDAWYDVLVAPLVGDAVKAIRVGGETRAQSVCHALGVLDDSHDDTWVMVHDAARPCIQGSFIKKLHDEVLQRDAIGGLLAVPMVDTVKYSEDEVQVKKTLDRKKLWAAQTPQMFKLDVLYNALSDALVDETIAAGITDEASVMEWAGVSPLLVQGEVANLKVTYPHDFKLAEFWLTQMKA